MVTVTCAASRPDVGMESNVPGPGKAPPTQPLDALICLVWAAGRVISPAKGSRPSICGGNGSEAVTGQQPVTGQHQRKSRCSLRLWHSDRESRLVWHELEARPTSRGSYSRPCGPRESTGARRRSTPSRTWRLWRLSHRGAGPLPPGRRCGVNLSAVAVAPTVSELPEPEGGAVFEAAHRDPTLLRRLKPALLRNGEASRFAGKSRRSDALLSPRTAVSSGGPAACVHAPSPLRRDGYSGGYVCQRTLADT